MSVLDRLRSEICAAITRRLGIDPMAGVPGDGAHAVARVREAFPDIAVEALSDWIERLAEAGPEWQRLASLLTNGETYFFRDWPWFESLEAHVLGPLIARRRQAADLRVRIWSAGCSTGEEPFSLAILLDRLLPDRANWSVRILATDVNPIALETAERGLYRKWSFRQTPPYLIDRYFASAGAGLFELDPMIRNMVTFAPLNLIADGDRLEDCDAKGMDLVVCRNVIMYFEPKMRRVCIDRLQKALAPDGWLLTSSAESWPELFQPLTQVLPPGLIGFRTVDGPAPEEAHRFERPSDAPRSPRTRKRAAAAASPRPEPSATPPPRTGKSARVSAESGSDALARARSLADRGDYARACALCEQALAHNLLDHDGHLLHAQICQELGDRRRARDALRRALYLRPHSVPANFLLGNLYEGEGEHEAARRCMRNVVSLAETGASGRSGVEEADAEANRFLEAARAFLLVRDARGRRDRDRV